MLESCIDDCDTSCETQVCKDECATDCKLKNDAEDLTCVQCGDTCISSDLIATATCPESEEEIDCEVKQGECVVSEDDENGTVKVKLCHSPNGNNPHTIEVSEPAVDAHLKHGDYFGEGENELIDLESELGSGGVNSGIAGELDRFFDNIFQDDLENMKERFAEIRTLVNEGKYDEAKELIDQYKEIADELEKEVDPEKKEEAKNLSRIIKAGLRDIESQIPEDELVDFKKNVQRSANNIGVAAEIASKIKELCTSLAEIDPVEYYKVCKTDDDAPDWQKKLNKDLTEDQKKEAKKFAKIMRQCFKTSGQECSCEEIPYKDFANACLKAAPLAKACDIDGDEEACEKLDNLDMPRLPDHLQEVFDELERDISEAQFDLHMPRECVDAGATTPQECSKLMIELNAPEECKESLLAADIRNEREGREICDRIMMEKHAPECAEKGITDPDECARFMDSFRRDDHFDRGPRINFDCKEITDPEERLECYDKSASQANSYKGFNDEGYEGPCMTESDWAAKKKECRDLYGEHAGDEPIMGDSGQGYECVIDAKCVDFGQFKDEFQGEFGSGEMGPTCGDCQKECGSRPGERLKRTDCGPNGCECFFEPIEDHSSDDYQEPTSDSTTSEPTPSDGGSSGEGGEEVESTETESDGSSGGSGNSEPEPTPEPEPEPEPTPDAVTGEFLTGNYFLNYYYN